MKSSRRLQRLIRKSALAVLILLCLTSSGCAKRITLYPITDTDLYIKDNGDVCMSEFYFNEVLQAELESK